MSEIKYDVAVIGGGVVGCAVLFELTRQGFTCVLLEKNKSIMSEASAGNSGMLHTGFDSPLYSLEQQCIRSSQNEIFNIINHFSIPFKKCGAILVAWTDHQVVLTLHLKQNEKLPLLKQQAHTAGVCDVDLMTEADLYKKEPHLKQVYKGALNVPGEGVIDSNLLGLIFAQHARMQGSKILTDCQVTGVNDRMLSTTQGNVHFKVAINCAGLYGDKVDHLANINTFSITPRKGQYCVFGKSAGNFLNSMIFPVPTEKSKGVALFNSVYNNLIIGPTAEDVEGRSQQPCDPQVHLSLLLKAHWMIPELSNFSPIGQYAGLRPATEFKDYQIRTYPQLGWITVGGIRSTGVSGSLGIGQYVSERLLSDMGVEPERGSMRQLLAMPWRLDDKRSSLLFEQHQYQIMHPMCLYGHEIIDSKL
ncbi:unnamed protein product [Lymnaea stagnalis]|uniref:FAD dependent oxidoreductase domain-containing protein n=1 Tax=Lymnaea stagnalis TaxID=6523 RepID=A0AAV2HL90_LYMST